MLKMKSWRDYGDLNEYYDLLWGNTYGNNFVGGRSDPLAINKEFVVVVCSC